MFFKLILLLSIVTLQGCTKEAANPGIAPYPPSPVIKEIRWDYSSHKKAALGSDMWATTWGADDNLYAVWGDGGGFGGNNDKGREYLGIARIEGEADKWKGTNVHGGYNGLTISKFSGKANSIIAVGKSLYMAVTEQDKWQRAKIGRSDDNGLTWTFNNGSFDASTWDFAEPGGAFAAPAYIQFGQANNGALDDYIYLYSRRTRTDSETQIILARVLNSKIQQRSAYEFFTGLDTNQKSQWSNEINSAKTIFEDTVNGINWGYQAFYHPTYKRFFLTVRASNANNGRTGRWGIYDAPSPWGPWTTVDFYNDWDANSKFKGSNEQIVFNFPTKWIDKNNKDLWMVFSINDSFNLIKGTLIQKNSNPN